MAEAGEVIESRAKVKRVIMDEVGDGECKKPKVDMDGVKSDDDCTLSEPVNEAANGQAISSLDTNDLVHTNEKSLAEVFGSTNSSLITAADINRMNRERGLEIVAMASRHDALVDSASRAPAANLERNKIWNQITEEINEKYSHLNALTFEQCKKLCKYYKRKDPNNYIGGKNELLKESDICLLKSDQADIGTEIDENKKLASDAISSAEDIVREDDKPSSDLLQFLAQCSASTALDGLVNASQQSVALSNQLKKERGHFVCKMAETFGTIFDSHSRTYQVNAERNQIWKQIADLTNEKYSADLGDLTVEQTKKLYANYKRKYQMLSLAASGSSKLDAGNGGGTSVDMDSDASSCNSDVLNRFAAPSTMVNNHNRIGSPNLLPRITMRDRKANTDLKNGQRIATSPGLSTVELLAIIADRDAEIKQLKNELLQKSVEHQLQISRVFEKMSELVKTAVNTNVQREIMAAIIGISTAHYHHDAFSDKDFDDDNDL